MREELIHSITEIAGFMLQSDIITLSTPKNTFTMYYKFSRNGHHYVFYDHANNSWHKFTNNQFYDYIVKRKHFDTLIDNEELWLHRKGSDSLELIDRTIVIWNIKNMNNPYNSDIWPIKQDRKILGNSKLHGYIYCPMWKLNNGYKKDSTKLVEWNYYPLQGLLAVYPVEYTTIGE